MLTVLIKTLTIFSMTGVGFVANKTKVLPIESNDYLVNLLILITSPCLIISSMTSRALTSETVRSAAEVSIGSLIYFIGFAIISFFIVRALRCPKEDMGVLMVIIVAINTGFLGFPVTKAIFGDDIFFLMVIQNCILNIYLYLISVIQMNYGHGKSGRGHVKDMAKHLANNNNIAMVISLVIMASGITLPGPVAEFFKIIGDATIPLSMIVLGVRLADCSLMSMLRNKALIIVSLINVIFVPALTFLAVNWLPIMTESKITLIFATAFPCAVVTVAVAQKEGKNSGLMAEGVAMTTLMSLITLPIAAVLLMSYYL